MGLIREAIDLGRIAHADNKEQIYSQLQKEANRRIEYERRQDQAIDQIWEGLKNFFKA